MSIPKSAMKLSALILTSLLPLSLAAGEMEGVCSIAFDRHDRAAMYSRNFIVGGSTKWPNGVVPYVISKDFSASDVTKIKEAMKTIEGGSCIKFVPHTDQPNYAGIVTGGGGCYANLGFNPWRKVLTVHLQSESYCTRPGTVMHELLHALGYAHEHTRPDRDQHVKMHWGKLPKGYLNNWFRAGGVDESPLPPVCDPNDPEGDFDKCYAGFKADTFGVPYDFGSVMHYDLRAGTSDGSYAMEPVKPLPFGVYPGQRSSLSKLDFEKVNKAYNCDNTPAPTTTTEKTTTTTTTPTTTTTTTTTTEETTTTSEEGPTDPSCVDKYSYCQWVKGYCETYTWLQQECKKSCGTCGGKVPTTTKPPCVNKYSNCERLGHMCEDYESVRNGCPFICGIC